MNPLVVVLGSHVNMDEQELYARCCWGCYYAVSPSWQIWRHLSTATNCCHLCACVCMLVHARIMLRGRKAMTEK